MVRNEARVKRWQVDLAFTIVATVLSLILAMIVVKDHTTL